MEKTNNKNPMIGTKVTPVPVDKKEIGIDTDNTLVSNIVTQAIASNVDISALEGFSTVARTREQTYQIFDTMSEDPILASYLKTLTEDSVETNDAGQIVWCESDDAKCAKYVTYLLDSLNVDKNAYGWMYSLIKYGDLYLRLYRQSDYEKDELFSEEEANKKEKLNESVLKEDVNIVVHEDGDHYVHYVEPVANPNEMFEMTKFGKSMGFAYAPTSVQTNVNTTSNISSIMQYKLRKNDVTIYSATDFVHGALEDNSSRVPEEVNIFLDSEKEEETSTKQVSYKVRRGQSELASIFKIWRELSLLENSALLNRITKSAIVRIIGVEVGNMPKEQIGPHLNSVKSVFEQKTALNKGTSMGEYTNPGPIENLVYVPTHGGQGNITAQTIGGDFDPKQFTDIDYFQDKLFGALGVPKAFFGITDDGAGFNGGTSLAIQSSRYGKSIKRVQNTFCQMITDLINLMLLDKGLTHYINKFVIRMQAPVTQEELDRRENKRNKVGVISDIMQQLQDVQDPIVKLKILKSLLADSITDVEIISLLQEYIDSLEEEAKPKEGDNKGSTNNDVEEPLPEFEGGGELPPMEEPLPMPEEESSPMPTRDNSLEVNAPEEGGEVISNEIGGEESYLPSPEQLGQDMTANI